MLRPGTAGRVFVAALASAGLVSGILAGGALAVAPQIQADDDFFSAATYTMDQGDKPTLLNNGVNLHNATAKLNGPDGMVLFESATVGNGVTTPAEGAQYLTVGSYAFLCTIHPLSMQAALQVSSAGTPVRRPSIDVTAAKGKVAKVAKKGKLPVTVRALTDSDKITLTLKLGMSKIGSQPEFNLAAGQQRKLSVKLTKAGKKQLRKKSKATVKVIGDVRFGASDTAKANLK
ncbi:MAG: hypothetical protein FJW90_00690 [Actinobacteria bacterium]|nr:hypothetical protein [Actinomycetota bacterium]